MRAIVLSLRADDGSLSALAVRTGAPLIRPLQPTCGIFAGWAHAQVTVTYRDASTRTFTFDRTPASSTDPSQDTGRRTHAGTARMSFARFADIRIARLVRAQFV
jgi:hypothetical protein